MVCKIHKNIKSSLRETIKGRDAQSTSNTILSCALAASTHLHPPLLSFPCLPVSHFLSAFLSFYSISSQRNVLRWTVILHPSHGGCSVVPQAMCGYQRQTLFPLEMFRGGEGKKEQAPFDAVLALCPG